MRTICFFLGFFIALLAMLVYVVYFDGVYNYPLLLTDEAYSMLCSHRIGSIIRTIICSGFILFLLLFVFNIGSGIREKRNNQDWGKD